MPVDCAVTLVLEVAREEGHGLSVSTSVCLSSSPVQPLPMPMVTGSCPDLCWDWLSVLLMTRLQWVPASSPAPSGWVGAEDPSLSQITWEEPWASPEPGSEPTSPWPVTATRTRAFSACSFDDFWVPKFHSHHKTALVTMQ